MPLPPPPKIGSLQLSSPLLLAPLSGRTDMAFRLGVRRIGGLGLAFTDLTSPHAVLLGNRRTSQILATCEEDRPLGVQLYGHEARIMAEAASRLEEEVSPAIIDINMGCPVYKVTRKGGGSALMAAPENAERIAAAVVEAVKVPVTAKLRLGTDAAHVNAPEVARRLAGVGVSALTVHGRTADQRYSGPVNLQGIRSVAEAVPDIPVFANGNIIDYDTAMKALAATGCAGLAIGRGAMYNPWIFSQIAALDRGEAPPEPEHNEVISFMRQHFRRLLELRGSYSGCRQFRKWVSHYGSALKMSRDQHDRFTRISEPGELESLADELSAGPG